MAQMEATLPRRSIHVSFALAAVALAVVAAVAVALATLRESLAVLMADAEPTSEIHRLRA
jgi:uncharacterized membrane-anchored protein